MAMAEVLAAYFTDEVVLVAHSDLRGDKSGFLHAAYIPGGRHHDHMVVVPDRRRVVTCVSDGRFITVHTSELVPLDKPTPTTIELARLPIQGEWGQMVSAWGSHLFAAYPHDAGTRLQIVDLETGATSLATVSMERGAVSDAFRNIMVQGSSAVAFIPLLPI